jgi:penicillin-binding protein 2
MRTALLKDPELRSRIEKPLPMPELPPAVSDVPEPPTPIGPDPTQATPA